LEAVKSTLSGIRNPIYSQQIDRNWRLGEGTVTFEGKTAVVHTTLHMIATGEMNLDTTSRGLGRGDDQSTIRLIEV
jgi:hypothetical protein